MKGQRKFRLKYLLTGLLTAFLFFTQTWKSAAFHLLDKNFYIPLTALTDTTRPEGKRDTVPQRPIIRLPDSLQPRISKSPHSINQSIDTNENVIKIDTFLLKVSKDSLDAPVNYEAEDSVVVLIKDKKVVLYGKTKTDYKDIKLDAPKTELDQQSQILTAINKKDTNGVVIERARFVQGENTFQSDTIRYNFKTQKGITKNTHTMQGEIQLQGDEMKRIGTTIYSRHGVITTCNLDDPHFGFRYDKIKMVNSKMAVTGPIHPEFENVPIPIYLPFGFFPMNKGRHSGLLPPQFATNEQFGLGLEGLGYYKVLNENFDVTLRGNVYSYGGWSVNVIPFYRKRYKYSGQLNFSIQTTKFNFKGDPDYAKNKSYFITWNHTVDSKARPGTSFTASVNAGSTKYNKYIPNNVNKNYQNQLGSSITYSKTWIGKPFNLTVSANHNQNNSLNLINVNLPDVGFTVNTIYPFQGKTLAGTPKWYEKLGVGYNGSFKNQISFYDTVFQFKKLIDSLQWGAQHNFPISLSLPPIFGGKFLISPGISYSQKWIAQKFRRSWNSALKKIDTSITKGAFIDQQISTSVGINTALYGTFQFKNSRIIAIRHVVRPSVSVSYSPSLSKAHYYETRVDTSGNKFRFSEFDRSLFGSYGGVDFGGMSFSLDNNLEMKMRSRKDTGQEAIKKIKLIDGYGLNFNYNFIADSLRLSNFNFYLRSTLFEKINITASTILNPYKMDKRGFTTSKYAWQDGKFNPGRFTSGNLSISANFKSKAKDQKKEDERKKKEQQMLDDPALRNDMQSQLEYMRRNPSEFVDFNIPWSLSLGFSLYFNEKIKPDYSGVIKNFSSNLNFNGSFNLTPKWNFSMNGYYNFDKRNLQTFQMSISREMHCWQMAINVTPVGTYRYFSINVSPKSGLLQDLKINRTRYFYSN